MADSIAAAVTAAPSPLRAPVPAAPEVLSLFAPASSLSPIRIFVSLCVLLVFLLVAFFSPPKKNARNRGAKVAVSAAGGGGKKKSAKTVLLVGPLAAGKTALFSKVGKAHVNMYAEEMRYLPSGSLLTARVWPCATDAHVDEGERDRHHAQVERCRQARARRRKGETSSLALGGG